MKAYGGVDIYNHVCLTSTLVGGEWSASRPGRFTAGEKAIRTHWRGDWLGSRICIDYVKRREILPLPELELRPLGRLAAWPVASHYTDCFIQGADMFI
jgi:hypothetical protein